MAKLILLSLLALYGMFLMSLPAFDYVFFPPNREIYATTLVLGSINIENLKENGYIDTIDIPYRYYDCGYEEDEVKE